MSLLFALLSQVFLLQNTLKFAHQRAQKAKQLPAINISYKFDIYYVYKFTTATWQSFDWHRQKKNAAAP